MIDINNESGVQADELGLVALARFALSRLRIHPQADLSILLVDEATMPSTTSVSWTCPARPT